MRKQYHFRQVGEDTYIWDVHHLVELSQDFPIHEVLLSDIQELNEAYWFPDTHPTTQQMIEHFQLMQQADLSYPIILSADGRVMDGMHRAAMQNYSIILRLKPSGLKLHHQQILSILTRMIWIMLIE